MKFFALVIKAYPVPCAPEISRVWVNTKEVEDILIANLNTAVFRLDKNQVGLISQDAVGVCWQDMDETKLEVLFGT